MIDTVYRIKCIFWYFDAKSCLTVFIGNDYSAVRPRNDFCYPADQFSRGVFREGRGHGPPIVDWVDFLRKKPALLGLFSPPEVFCGPQIIVKYAKNALSRTPLREFTPSPILSPLGAFGASILAPSALSFCGPKCKILAPLLRRCKQVKSPIKILTKTTKQEACTRCYREKVTLVWTRTISDVQ